MKTLVLDIESLCGKVIEVSYNSVSPLSIPCLSINGIFFYTDKIKKRCIIDKFVSII
jgi:hypothetical protein